MKPLRNAMRREAGRVWQEKARAARLGLFMSEETITELTLLNLAAVFQGHGLLVQPFTKAQETRNGADWEFWFIQGARSVGLRVQAKRLFPNGNYASLEPGGSQNRKLILHAGRCCPVYIFYNDAPAYRCNSPDCACGEYRGPSYRGCTLAPAAAVARTTNNSASSLQGVTIPWHCLVCESAANTMSLPETIAENLNRRFAQVDGHRCEAVATPHEFRPYDDIKGHPGLEFMGGDGYDEPGWLAGYLSERELAGIALVGATERTG